MQTLEIDTALGERVSTRDPVYLDIIELLDDEAAMLDDERLEEWLELMSEDVRYWAPVRVTLNRGQGLGYSDKMGHFDENLPMLQLRVRRLRETKTAWSEDPPSRTRRFVTNVRPFRLGDDSYRVASNILLLRSRGDRGPLDILSARREDLWRRSGDGWKCAERTILLDQTTLMVQNLSFFL
jgi:3-phenylpropionate/cinnamic acid dioxygenase small subunit